MIRFCVHIILWVGAVLLVSCSAHPIVSERTKKVIRVTFAQKLKDSIVAPALTQNWNDVNWNGTFWGMYMFHQKNDTSLSILQRCAANYDSMGTWQRYQFWLSVNTLFPNEFKGFADRVKHVEQDAKVKAALAQVLMNEVRIDSLGFERNNKYRNCLQHQNDALASVELSDMEQMFQNSLFLGKKHIISFQPNDRNYTGLAVVLDADGTLQRTKDNQIQTFRQLARSATNMPYYLTNGNSPCGIYSMQGIDHSDNVFIGPTSTIVTAMPHEVTPNVFFHGKISDTIWKKEMYRQLIPAKFGDYSQLWQSYRAGECGRSEIILHGSTIHPDFYKAQSFYPLTPSLGCITALELWDETDGTRKQSSQEELVTTYQEAKGENGFMVLIDLFDEQRNLQQHDINNFLTNSIHFK